jgi:AGCS family alanine or glycine:cation symporter
MDSISKAILLLGKIVWGPHLLIFILGIGLFLSIRLRFIQIRKLGLSFKLMWRGMRGKLDQQGRGEISPFQSLMTALAGTVGNGNIAGVATSITMGGPGAIFWMWIAAFVGMATKFTESLLAVKYRKVAEDGSILGGPIAYISRGLGLRWLGTIFAFFMLIRSCSVTLTQGNSIALIAGSQLHLSRITIGIALAFFVWLVIIGGIRRIGWLAGKLSPFMVIIYIVSTVIIVVINAPRIPDVFRLIFASAFKPMAAIGGFTGASVMMAMRFGLARSTFSNEAGMGSASFAYSAARSRDPVQQGIMALQEVFIDTLVICTLTALVVLLTGNWADGTTSTILAASAFSSNLGMAGRWIVFFSSLLFGYSTLIGWPYYGEQCIAYFFGAKAKMPYRWIFCLLIILGAVMRVDVVWITADVLTGLVTIPNLIALVGLSGIVSITASKYFKKRKNQK